MLWYVIHWDHFYDQFQLRVSLFLSLMMALSGGGGYGGSGCGGFMVCVYGEIEEWNDGLL